MNVNGSIPDFLYSSAQPVASSYRRAATTSRSTRAATSSRAPARRSVHAALVGERRAATDGRASHGRLSSGRPTIVAKISDAKSGVDPVAPALLRAVDAATRSPLRSGIRRPGIAAFSIPREAPPLGRHAVHAGRRLRLQESKNINTDSDSPLPNTRFQGLRAEAVNRPTITWITPEKGKCLAARQKLLVVANATSRSRLSGSSTEPPDRPRAPERRRALRAELADAREAQGRAHAQGGRLGRARARGGGEADRPDLQ